MRIERFSKILHAEHKAKMIQDLCKAHFPDLNTSAKCPLLPSASHSGRLQHAVNINTVWGKIGNTLMQFYFTHVIQEQGCTTFFKTSGQKKKKDDVEGQNSA